MQLNLALIWSFRPYQNGGSEHGKAEESKGHLPEQKTHVRMDI